MTPEMEALGRRAVACKGWQWMPGMLVLATAGPIVTPAYRLGDSRHPSFPMEYDWPHDLGLRVPDLSDPATLGCLWSLVGDPGAPMDAAVLVGMLEGTPTRAAVEAPAPDLCPTCGVEHVTRWCPVQRAEEATGERWTPDETVSDHLRLGSTSNPLGSVYWLSYDRGYKWNIYTPARSGGTCETEAAARLAASEFILSCLETKP